MTEKPRKLKPPRYAKVTGPVRVSYTSDYINYIGHQLEREAKGQPAEDYCEWLDRRAGYNIITDEELMRRIREMDERARSDDR